MSEPAVTLHRTQPPVVWVVDDSQTERAITVRTLGTAFELVQFADGSEAVERLASGSQLPDLVLLDWVMPGMTGDEVCRFVRTHPRTKELPIILVTASRIETTDVVAGLSAGANDYVARPFAPEELRARVHAALRAKQLADIAARERSRLATINRLGGALFKADNTPAVLEQLAGALLAELCDGCSIMLLPGELEPAFLSMHRAEPAGELLATISSLADPAVHAYDSPQQARDRLPPAYHPYIDRFGLRGLAIMPFPIRSPIAGVVTLTRDGDSQPFDAADISTIETCIEYAGLAVQSAMRFDAERLARSRLEEVAEFQEQMLGIVGHDLRNPLGAIMTGADILKQFTPDAKVNSVAGRIHASATRMARIVDQLLDVTRARLGSGIPLTLRPTNLVALAQGVIDELLMAHAKSTFRLTAPVEVHGSWDPDRLSQVVGNLCANAVHYGKASAPITIQIEATPRGARLTVHNELRDEPIPADQLATLFIPYKRGEVRTNATGLGLGLFIVHEIVAAHGGHITASSDQTGTYFRVELPSASPR